MDQATVNAGTAAAIGAMGSIAMQQELKRVATRVADQMNRPGEWLENLLANDQYKSVGRAEYLAFKVRLWSPGRLSNPRPTMFLARSEQPLSLMLDS